MKLGITGLPGSGKKTVFEALTGIPAQSDDRSEYQIGMVNVPDERLDRLHRMYRPRKTTPARVAYLIPHARKGREEPLGDRLQGVRDCDALIYVVRNFNVYGLPPSSPASDISAIEQEMMLSDLAVVEKRLERLVLDRKRGKAIEGEEQSLLEACRDCLGAEVPLRTDSRLQNAPALKGYAFLSAKPRLILYNNEDEDDTLPPEATGAGSTLNAIIKGKLEQELVHMSANEAKGFLAEFNLTASAKDRILTESYALLGLISFFTVGEDEVKAWTIRQGTTALDAAGAVHSDMKKGFICAETVSYNDLTAAGNFAAAKRAGVVRLEGKTYPVADGDIIHFRFNV